MQLRFICRQGCQMWAGAILGWALVSFGGGGEVCAAEGHDVPTPFEAVNQRFELADGEIYLLKGTVATASVWVEGREKEVPYLVLNLKDYPFLANARRVEAPYYPIEGDIIEWSEQKGRQVKLSFRAKSKVFASRSGYQQVIFLEPMLGRVRNGLGSTLK